jgi:hypothetical protein
MFRRYAHKVTFEEACQTLNIDPAKAQAMGYWRRRAIVSAARDIREHGTEAIDPGVGEAFRGIQDRGHLPGGLL